jgi:hypothetical protein
MKPAVTQREPPRVAPAFVPPSENGYYDEKVLGCSNMGSGSRVAPSFPICGYDGPVFRVQSNVWTANIGRSSGH